MDKVIVAVSGIFSIAAVWWFFLGKKEDKEKAVEAKGSVDIKVEGGYDPSTIVISKGKKTILNLKRTDSSSCLEEMVIPEFKIKKYLPMNKTVSIEITPQKSGEFPFSCGMNMFHGKLIVT